MEAFFRMNRYYIKLEDREKTNITHEVAVSRMAVRIPIFNVETFTGKRTVAWFYDAWMIR